MFDEQAEIRLEKDARCIVLKRSSHENTHAPDNIYRGVHFSRRIELVLGYETGINCRNDLEEGTLVPLWFENS